MFAYKFGMSGPISNPLQINPIEASAPIHLLQSMSCITNASILLQSSPVNNGLKVSQKYDCVSRERVPSGAFQEVH